MYMDIRYINIHNKFYVKKVRVTYNLESKEQYFLHVYYNNRKKSCLEKASASAMLEALNG